MPTKHILLGISGGIAAYKSCELVRLLRKQGHTVNVAMSCAAAGFVSPQTFQALSGHTVWTDDTADSADGMAHIHLSREADVFLITPASANTLAKIAHGMADNLLSTLAAARACPLAVAPAMNVEMWRNPANLRNIAQLQADGITVFGPANGSQACSETGEGRMLEAAELAELLPDLWTPKLLADKRILLTAGATFEAIDPVRGITNLSSGRMDVALAQACRAAGAEVVLVAGQLQVAPPTGIAVHHTHSAREMHEAVMREIDNRDVFISVAAVAAVADYHVANRSTEKLKKDGSGTPPVIELAENPDILATVARLPNAPFCVGFAAESHNVLEHARAKRLRKGVPLIVANHAVSAMVSGNNQVTLISDSAETALPEMGKHDTADAIVAEIARLLEKAT